MEKYITMKSTKGSTIVLMAKGNQVKVEVTGDTGKASGHLVTASGTDLRLDTGTVIAVAAEDAARASTYLEQARTAPAGMNLASKIAIGVVASIAVLYLIGVMIGSQKSTTPAQTLAAAPADAAPTGPAGPTAVAVGSYVSNDKTAIMVTQVLERAQVGDQYIHEAAAEGGVLVVVAYKVKNVSDKPIEAYNLPKLKLVDPSGTEYDPDIGKPGTYATENSNNMKAFSDLNPDIAVTDADVYEVSKAKFDPATWHAKAPDGTLMALQ